MSSGDFPGIKKCLELVCSDDPMTFEDGYHLLLPRVGEYVVQISEALKEERNPSNQAKLIELLGECEDETLVPLLTGFLNSESGDIVSWSLTALEKTAAGTKVAKKFRQENPEWAE